MDSCNIVEIRSIHDTKKIKNSYYQGNLQIQCKWQRQKTSTQKFVLKRKNVSWDLEGGTMNKLKTIQMLKSILSGIH